MLYINRYKYIKEITNSEFKAVIDNVDLYDICNYIISLDTDTWVHSSYWSRAKAKLFKELERKKEALKDPHRGEVMWAIYSYLVHNKILMIEDELSKSGFRKRDSYYNLLESQLYHPILTRLINEGFLVRTHIPNPRESGIDRYKIGSSYNRMSNLEKLNI